MDARPTQTGPTIKAVVVTLGVVAAVLALITERVKRDAADVELSAKKIEHETAEIERETAEIERDTAGRPGERPVAHPDEVEDEYDDLPESSRTMHASMIGTNEEADEWIEIEPDPAIDEPPVPDATADVERFLDEQFRIEQEGGQYDRHRAVELLDLAERAFASPIERDTCRRLASYVTEMYRRIGTQTVDGTFRLTDDEEVRWRGVAAHGTDSCEVVE